VEDENWNRNKNLRFGWEIPLGQRACQVQPYRLRESSIGWSIECTNVQVRIQVCKHSHVSKEMWCHAENAGNKTVGQLEDKDEVL